MYAKRPNGLGIQGKYFGPSLFGIIVLGSTEMGPFGDLAKMGSKKSIFSKHLEMGGELMQGMLGKNNPLGTL